MASKSKRARMAPQRDLTKIFLYWAIGIFLLKLVIISNIQGGAWNAADGENYATGLNALINDGVFSKEKVLNYWPAGYPLFLFLLTFLGTSWIFTTLAVVQSALFSFSAYYFAKFLAKTRIKKYSFTVFILIICNPTLSLSSMSIGYESLAASGSLLAIGIVIKDLIEVPKSNFLLNLLNVSLIFGFLTFIQPRLIVASALILLIWVFKKNSLKSAACFSLLSLAVVLFFPATLIYRNQKAVEISSVSTNLGITMNIGAGDGATGGYDSEVHGVKCEIVATDAGVADSERIKCVLNWYLSNPTKALKLFFNKTIYFWSPWSGPLLSGTMGLNPWLKINPITNISKTPDGSKLVAGPVGKIFAILWILGGMTLLFYGFTILWRSKGLERFIGVLAILTIGSSWAITLLSIGDHRFRVPVMGMSLFLQAIGLRTVFKAGKVQMVDSPSLR